MPSPGEPAPDFEAPSTHGPFRLSSLRGRRVVLYFFPKAFTAGCTRELQRFAELYDQFRALNAEVVGVSRDSVDTLRRFASRYGARFPLVSDGDMRVIGLYGAANERGTGARRVTFVIDEGGVVKAVIEGLRRAEEHADKALEALRSMG